MKATAIVCKSKGAFDFSFHSTKGVLKSSVQFYLKILSNDVSPCQENRIFNGQNGTLKLMIDLQPLKS